MAAGRLQNSHQPPSCQCKPDQKMPAASAKCMRSRSIQGCSKAGAAARKESDLPASIAFWRSSRTYLPSTVKQHRISPGAACALAHLRLTIPVRCWSMLQYAKAQAHCGMERCSLEPSSRCSALLRSPGVGSTSTSKSCIFHGPKRRKAINVLILSGRL